MSVNDLTWKRYKVMAMIDVTLPEEVCVVEAPSSGMALEHYLACHGMMGYNYAFVEETDQEPSEDFTRAALEGLVEGMGMDLCQYVKACEAHVTVPFPPESWMRQ